MATPSARISDLNRRALRVWGEIVRRAAELRVAIHGAEMPPRIIDCGIAARGGLETGRLLAEVCLADLGGVSFVPARPEFNVALAVQVVSDHPVAACLGSQYAGWRIQSGKFFAMGSGPMRAAGSREPLIDELGFRETTDQAIGVLETRRIPDSGVCGEIAAACGVTAENLKLLVAPTASQAGTVQVVARSIETALHKLHELGFDVRRVESAHGVAPLPPVARDDLAGIGLTNDAILYGGEVTLWVRGDDDSLADVGPKVPSASSSDHGRPFAEIFAAAGHDFYRIDPHLFSPAVVTLVNLDTGRVHRHGRLAPEVFRKSCGT